MAAAGLACAWAAGGATAAGTLVASGAGAVVLTRWRAAAAGRERRATQIPGALDRLATALRAGTSLPSSLAEVGSAVDPPLGPELTALGEATARGRPVVDVLDDWAARHDDPPTRLAGTALVLATLVGSVPARAVDGVAATVRERLDLAAERRALAAQARASAVVLTVAPLAFAALLVAGDTAAAGFLLGSPAGWSCLAGGVGLDVAGGIWMARLTRGRR
ncbi:MAG TPA: type II secretion system F family protein [Acidimicrobiales bacterium]|nr:type II secretion system F family protein [Acidimicrobiales bacterium]